VILVTVHRLPTERKHIALLGTVAILALPAAASATPHEHLQPRRRLRAGVPSATQVGVARLSDAKAVSGPLLDPVDRYSRLIAATTARAEHHQRMQARGRREARERFARLPGGVTMATLESIAACESGGDPEAISPEGTYRGKYQFDQGTWESVGGHGDPAAAPEAEQDYRAALLYSESGSSPWPVCG
jgi:hypothetical protein